MFSDLLLQTVQLIKEKIRASQFLANLIEISLFNISAEGVFIGIILSVVTEKIIARTNALDTLSHAYDQTP